jgi:hypothetical protein
MGAVAAAGAICALLSTVRSLGEGTAHDFRLLGTGIVGYTFYLVYLVWLSFAYFTRGQVLVLLAVTAVLATLVVQVVVAVPGWIGLSAILALPFMPFALGALMFRYGGNWVPEPEFADTGALAVLVNSKRGRGVLPQTEGSRPDLGPQRPPPTKMSVRKKALVLIAGVVVILLAVAGGQLIRRRMHFRELAAQQGREEDRCFLRGQDLEEGIDAALEKDPDSLDVQKWAEGRKLLAEQWYRKADWHGDRRRAYEDRWW